MFDKVTDELLELSEHKYAEPVEGEDYFPTDDGVVAGFYGKKHTEESKAIMRQRKLDNPPSYWTGREKTQEHKDRISATLKGRVESEETKQKKSVSQQKRRKKEGCVSHCHCGNEVLAKNLCSYHYFRQRHLDKTENSVIRRYRVCEKTRRSA